MPEPAPLYAVSRRHLEFLTDEVGIMQHAIGSLPDPAYGYCTDDIARALQVDLLHGRTLGWTEVADSAWRNMRFIADAFDATSGRFRNFHRIDGSWLQAEGSEDCQGRAMLALGETIAEAPDVKLVETATALFAQALPAAQTVTALRAQASVLLGCNAALQEAPADRTVAALRRLAKQLAATFQAAEAADQPWPEVRLTYENALPVRALIVAGQHLESSPMLDRGLRILDWLIAAQTAHAGHFSPVGNGWWPRGGEKAQFDQQPIEATSLLLAAEAAYLVTSDERYRRAMELAYAWFLGSNDLGIEVAEPDRGASFDGLTPSGVNLNQGAESTLMWLIALEHIRAIRGATPGRTTPIPAAAAVAAPPTMDLALATSTR